MKKLILLFLVSLPLSSFAQDLSNLKISTTTQKFLDENKGASDFLTESCPTIEDCEGFKYHSKTYKFRGDAREAFNKLIANRGKDIWNGTTKFDLVFDPKTNLALDTDSPDLPLIEVGQVYFLELGITEKMKIPVGFKIVEINHDEMKLAFSYLRRNKSNGIQRLTFKQQGKKFTIKHETRFQSDSKFRDALLYRPFHTKLLNEFYLNFENNILPGN
jgi:hypothetical protein